MRPWLCPCFVAVLVACSDGKDETGPPTDTAGPTTGPTTGPTDPTPAEPPAWTTFWGAAPPREVRLEVFDAIWDEYQAQYANFGLAGEDWDALRDRVRPEVADEESYGGFYRLLSHMFFEVREGHSVIMSDMVCATPLVERPPLFWSTGGGRPLGVCVTGTAEETALVVKADPGNPAGLEPGDEILGYDGVAWAELLDEALDLPFCGGHAAVAEAERHLLVRAAAENPHLFEQMDVRRGGTGAVTSVPTDGLLASAFPDLLCPEQVSVGVDVPWSTVADASSLSPVSYGRLPGTDIGYIYVYGWFGDAEAALLGAVEALWDTDGLIVDFRYNIGGNMWLAYPALAQLFAEDVTAFAVGVRGDPLDRTALDVLHAPYVLTADPATSYERPIAVLTGPTAVSSGDVVAFLLSRHPRARRFGLPTNGSFCFNPPTDNVWVPTDPILDDLRVTRSSCVGVDPDGQLLALAEVYPEEPVWHTPADVAGGTDTVVEAARAWVEGER
jgi:hypothetical protein